MSDKREAAMLPVKHAESSDNLRPLTESDQDVLAAMREVLLRHGALDRFGVTLLHDHFALSENEKLVESVDCVGRTITIRPSQDPDPIGAVQTAWRFTAEYPQAIANLTCHPQWDWDYSTNPPQMVYRHPMY